MKPERLMQKYNKTAIITCTIDMCNHFLTTYKDELKGKSYAEIDQAFADYMSYCLI